MDRRRFLQSAGGVSLGSLAAFPALADLLRAGADVSLKCLGTVNGPRFLDGRTQNGSVGLAPDVGSRFSGTKWHVFVSGGTILLQCRGVANGPRWLDGRTADGAVGLAPNTAAPFTGTRWRVLQIQPSSPDVVALQCMGNIQGPRWLDGRTGDASVGLARSIDPPFSGTHWEVRPYAVAFDQGSEGHPASN